MGGVGWGGWLESNNRRAIAVQLNLTGTELGNFSKVTFAHGNYRQKEL